MNAAASRSCTGVLVGYIAYVLMINWGRSWSGRCLVGKYHMYIIVNTVTRILMDERTHAVVDVDPAKEVQHCTRCKNYGHTQKFCKAKAKVCGKCAQEHSTSSCTVKTSDYRCANCHQSHQVGSPSYPALAKDVPQYLSYISTSD